MARGFTTLIWDYAVFIVFLIFSSVIPLWSRIFGKKTTKTKADYVFAAGKVSVFAMMMSIARGTLGVRSTLGYPSELFYRGSSMWETIYGMTTAYPIVLYVFIPVYFSLGITSIYQYLDLRFNSRLVRCLASGTFIFRQILNLGVTVYTPSVALNTIIGFPYWASIVGLTIISIIFNILGGLKAAINADVFQGVTMILVSIVIFAQGIFETGGIDKVYEINKDEGRLNFFTYGGPYQRADTVSAWLGQLFISMSLLGCQQNFVQRYVSMNTFKEVKKTMLSNIPCVFLLFSLAWFVGMGIFSTYVGCDPLKEGYIKKMDEILPFFVEDKFMYLPGFLGLFMATLFNGALSINVSNVNSLATVTWEDFMSRLPYFKGYSDKQQLNAIKILGCIFSVVIMGVAFSVGLLSGVIESAMLMTSVTSGPLLGVFLLAILVPIANWKGAVIGMVCSHITTIWLTFGSFTIDKPQQFLETSVEHCTNETFSQGITKASSSSWLLENMPLEVGWNIHNSSYLTSTTAPMQERTTLESIYSITYLYWSIIGTLVTVIIGTLVSWATRSKSDEYDPKLLHPIITTIRNLLSRNKRQQNSETSSIEIAVPSSSVSIINLNEPTKLKDELQHDNLAFEIEDKSRNLLTDMAQNSRGSTKSEEESILGRNLPSIISSSSLYSPETTGVYKKVEPDC